MWKILRRIWQELESIVIVTMFTVLVWLYAEGANVKTKELRVDVQFVPPPGARLLIEPTAPPEQVVIKFRSATGVAADVERLMPKPFRVALAEDPANPYQKVDLRQRLASERVFVDRGVTLETVKPETASVRVDGFVTKPVAVTATPETPDLQLAGLSAGPAEVTVEMPASEARGVDWSKVKGEAVLTAADAARAPEGVPQEKMVAVRFTGLPASPHLEVNPKQVKLSFTVRSRVEELALQTVPVQVVGSPVELSKFAVELAVENRFLSNVKISGPREVIEAVDRDRGRVWAGLHLTADELEKQITSKQVRLHVPPGVTVLSPPTEPTIKFTITRKP